MYELGVEATVVMGRESHGPTVWRSDLDLTEIEGDAADGALVSNLRVVSIWTLSVALYALQNPTPENIDRALDLIGTSGDVDDALDEEKLRPLPVPLPDGFGYEGGSQ